MGIASLLNPRSIAIVGASEKVGPGYNAFKALEYVGFSGRIDQVNPKSSELFGRQTFASLDQISGTIDAVFIAVHPADIDAVARTVSALSHFIADHGGQFLEVEINPLAVMEGKGGCVALDCVLLATK